MNRLGKPVLLAVLLSLVAAAGPVSDLQGRYQALRDDLQVRYSNLRDALRDEDWQAAQQARLAIRADEERLEACRLELSSYTFLPEKELQPYDPTEATIRYDSISDRPYYVPIGW